MFNFLYLYIFYEMFAWLRRKLPLLSLFLFLFGFVNLKPILSLFSFQPLYWFSNTHLFILFSKSQASTCKLDWPWNMKYSAWGLLNCTIFPASEMAVASRLYFYLPVETIQYNWVKWQQWHLSAAQILTVIPFMLENSCCDISPRYILNVISWIKSSPSQLTWRNTFH